jgi:hypothetical protein
MFEESLRALLLCSGAPFFTADRYLTLTTSTPGNGLPSSHSRKAPPAVET